jgi:membrane-associated phospholipid phosphatase
MTRSLAVLLWPAGIGAIFVLAVLLARRSANEPERATTLANGHGDSNPAIGPRSVRSSIVGLLLILVVGAVAVYALTCLLGVLVVHAGPHIDKPIYNWVTHHRVHFWKAAMDRLTKVGNTWTTWGACITAAICLAVFYRRNKWLPPVALAAAIVVDHYLTLALRHTFHRLGPPDSPFGTFPSGGCDRIVILYGLIAYLIWREGSRSRRAAIWAAGAVAALAFNEAYSRAYLTLHWSTDIVSGLIYGLLLLIVFIAAIRLVLGSDRRPLVEGGQGRVTEVNGLRASSAQ